MEEESGALQLPATDGQPHVLPHVLSAEADQAEQTRDRRDTLQLPDLTQYVDQGDGWFRLPETGEVIPEEPAIDNDGLGAAQHTAFRVLSQMLRFWDQQKGWRALSQWRVASAGAIRWQAMCADVSCGATELTQWLIDHNLSQYQDKLRDELGITEIADIAYLKPADLDQIGVPLKLLDEFNSGMSTSFEPLLLGTPGESVDNEELLKLSDDEKAQVLRTKNAIEQGQLLGALSEEELEKIPFGFS